MDRRIFLTSLISAPLATIRPTHKDTIASIRQWRSWHVVDGVQYILADDGTVLASKDGIDWTIQSDR